MKSNYCNCLVTTLVRNETYFFIPTYLYIFWYKKFFRFADVFGLDLADVKTFLDEVPKVPKSAFQDLKDAELSDLDSDSGSDRAFPVQPPSGPPISHQHGGHNSRKTGPYSAVPTFSPLFSQPSGNSDFFNKLRDRKVILENAFYISSSLRNWNNNNDWVLEWLVHTG